MKKLDFSFCLKDLEGKQLQIGNANGKPIYGYAFDLVSSNLLHPDFTEGNVIKKYTLATTIYNNKKIDVDDADFLLIKNATKNPGSQPPIIQAQLLIYLESIK